MYSSRKLISLIMTFAMLLSTLLLVLPMSTAAEDVTTAPAATAEPSALTVVWNKGYVGSRTNGSNKNKIAASAASTYDYSDVIVIAKAGTKISFTDDKGTVAASSAYVFSEWKLQGSSYVIDAVEGTNVIGTASYNGIGSTKVSGGQSYEYITDKDNQAIRICYQSADHAEPPVVTQVLTDAKSTKAQMAETSFSETFNADGTISGIQWFCGYASSATNTNGSAKETKPHSADYIHSGFIRIPEAGTTVTFTTESTHTPNNAFNGITKYKAQGEAYVYDDGLDGQNTRIYSASGNNRTYTYTSKDAGEVIRVCFKRPTDGNYWQNEVTVTAKWEKKGATPTLTGEKPVLDWPEAEILSLVTGAPLIGTEVATEWHKGYIGSQYHGSAPFMIASPNSVEYKYSDVITVPVKGTTVYFFDQTFTDYKGAEYASTSAMTVSHWKKSGTGWAFDQDKEYLDGCRAYSVIMNKYYRVYAYTTTEDNENIRLCLRLCSPDSSMEDVIPPVYFVAPTDFEAKAEKTGEFFESSYTDPDGKAASFEVYLPAGYTAEKQYSLVFDTSADGTVSALLEKCKYTGIIVKTAETGDRMLRVLDEVAKKYPVCVSDMLFIGGDEIYNHLKTYENLRLAEALLYTGEGEATLEYSEVKKLSETESAIAAAQWLVAQSDNYYNILEGLKVYAIGDSYFGGSDLGQHQTWVNLMGYKYNMNFINYGLGGNTVAYYPGISSSSPEMAERYTMMPDDGDIYIVEGGRNDRSKGVPIGVDTSTHQATFKGALNIIIQGIRQKNPDALIILVTAWSYKTETPSNNDYADAMKELAAYYNDKHIICLYAADEEWTGIDMSDPACRTKYCLASNDVSHLNVDGMNMVLPKFEKWIAEQYASFKGLEMTDTSTLEKLDLTALEESTGGDEVSTDGGNATGDAVTEPTEETGCGSAALGALTVVVILGAALIKRKEF